MGRKRASADADELLVRAEANGYRRGQHREADKKRDARKHCDKTKKDQDIALTRYISWQLSEMRRDSAQNGLPVPDEGAARKLCLGENTPAPDLADIKDFMRFHLSLSQGKIVKKPTADSANTFAEWFFAGFTRVTGTSIEESDRHEVYEWVRTTLVEEGVVVNVKRKKHNFTQQDLDRIYTTLWTQNDLIFIPERYRLQFTFIFLVYCWTGARLGAFFTGGGLRWKDVEIVLQRQKQGGWRVIYRLDQRWVKNNRDPESITFGAAGKEHPRLLYNETAILLVMAIVDGALFGYNSLNDIWEQEIPEGEDELILRFNDAMLDRPILRKCTKKEGVTDECMPKSQFLSIFRNCLRNAGYFCGTSIHTIRRQLGKKVDERYSDVQRSQHLTQADKKVFGQSYVANCSSVDGQSAFLDEEADHSHIHFFQSLAIFREKGLPCTLPLELELGLQKDSELRSWNEKVQSLEGPALDEAKRGRANYFKTLKREALRRYQDQWVQQRRDWKILTRGREQPNDPCKTDIAQHMFLLIPERGRLAQMLTSETMPSPQQTRSAMQDMFSLCSRTDPVVYLPGLEPVNGACPVKYCKLSMDSINPSERNQHIHECLRCDIASRRERLVSEIQYCRRCFQWVYSASDWELHCQDHLRNLESSRCGTITHAHTLVFPGTCPFCLGKEKLLAGRRLKPWTRDHKLWCHVNDHLDRQLWPIVCPHPLCDVSIPNDEALHCHFVDIHGFSRTRPAPNSQEKQSSTRERKRKATDQDDFLQWMAPVRSPTDLTTVSPTLLHNAVVDSTPPAMSTMPTASEALVMWSPHSVEPRSCTSSLPLTDDASFDDGLFSIFLRSPSLTPPPSTPPTVPDIPTPIGISSPRAPSQGSYVHENTAPGEPRPRVFLRINPPRPESKPKLVLRLTQPPRRGRTKRRRM